MPLLEIVLPNERHSAMLYHSSAYLGLRFIRAYKTYPDVAPTLAGSWLCVIFKIV